MMGENERERDKMTRLGGKKAGVLIFFRVTLKTFRKKVSASKENFRKESGEKEDSGAVQGLKLSEFCGVHSGTRINRKFSGRKCRHVVYFDLL